MDDDLEKLRMRVRLLEDELAGIGGAFYALADHFEAEGNSDLAADFHQRAARCRKLSGVQPTGGVQ